MFPWIAGRTDGNLDDEIVEFPWLQARQHAHLRPALDLEDADRIGPADHVIDRPFVGMHGKA